MRAGVEADHDVRQAHGAEERGEDQPVRGVQRAFLAALGRCGRQVTAAAALRLGDGRSLGEREPGAAFDAVRAGGQVEAGAGVRAAVHRAGHRDGEGPVQFQVDAVADADDALLAEGGRLVEGVAGGSVALPGEDQEQGGDQQGGEFQPVLEGLDEGDAAHAAGGDGGGHDDGDDHSAEPVGRPGQHRQGQSGALELGQQIQPAHADDEGTGQPPYGLGGEAGLGEVGKRVGAGAAQRGGDEEEQDQVAGGVADRVPEHVGALHQHEARYAQEGGGGEVLAADGGGVEAGADGAGGDVEVGGGAGDAQAEGAHEDRRDDDQGDGGDGVMGVHRSSTRRTKSRSLRSARRTYQRASRTSGA
ncbi:hypothetical protein SVIOM74S_09475 [Streptomyces violarus]